MTTATAEKTTPKNGTQKKVETPAKKSATTAVMTTSSEMQKELTIAETLEKVNHLKMLLDRREALATKRTELRKFKFGEDESSSVLTLIDQTNNEFKTANSNLIELLTKHLEELITVKIDECTDEILNYEF